MTQCPGRGCGRPQVETPATQHLASCWVVLLKHPEPRPPLTHSLKVVHAVCVEELVTLTGRVKIKQQSYGKLRAEFGSRLQSPFFTYIFVFFVLPPPFSHLVLRCLTQSRSASIPWGEGLRGGSPRTVGAEAGAGRLLTPALRAEVRECVLVNYRMSEQKQRWGQIATSLYPNSIFFFRSSSLKKLFRFPPELKSGCYQF